MFVLNVFILLGLVSNVRSLRSRGHSGVVCCSDLSSVSVDGVNPRTGSSDVSLN